MSRSGSGEIINFRGLNASIFTSRRFHFFVLELSYMQSKGRTMHTRVCTARAYE